MNFHYSLSKNGKILEDSENDKPIFTLIGYGNLIPGLENALLGKSQGDVFEVLVASKDGYDKKSNVSPCEYQLSLC